MGKTSERLEVYQTQMSIYAEQHKIILASDVLDMIEQLQDDLKDDIEKVVAELEELKEKSLSSYDYETMKIVTDIVRKGGVE